MPLEAVLMADAIVELQDRAGLRAFLPEAERIRQAVAGAGTIDRPRSGDVAGLGAESQGVGRSSRADE